MSPIITHPAYYFASTAADLPWRWITIRAAYAGLVRKAVTIVTVAGHRQSRRLRLDPAVGALRNTGPFMRPHPLGWRDDEVGGGDRSSCRGLSSPIHRGRRISLA